MPEDRSREAWIAIPTEAELRSTLPPGTKWYYDFGFIPAMGRLLMVHERIGPTMVEFYKQVMIEPGALTPGERELVAAVTSVAQDCHY